MNKRIVCLALLLTLLLGGCAKTEKTVQTGGIVTTTGQLFALTQTVLAGSECEKSEPLSCIVSEPISCLHDYSLSVRQMESIEKSRVIILSGLGLEDFMDDALSAASAVRIVAAQSVSPLPGDEGGFDPHVWLSPQNAVLMAGTIAEELSQLYPADREIFHKNAAAYAEEMAALQSYGEAQLSSLSCRKLVTFHDGFAYFAEAFGLEIAAAMEVEAGSEPSAKELEAIVALIRAESIPAIFVETNGTHGAAELIAAETGVKVYTLDMGLSGNDAIRQNIDTIKEALG